MNHQKGFASALVLIVALAAFGVGGYVYQAKKKTIRRIDEKKPLQTQNTQIKELTPEIESQLPEEVVKVNEARTFLESINYKTGSADVIIAPKIRFINVMKNYKTTQKQVNGFVMSPAPEGNVGGLLGSKGFKSDLYNSGDGTFRSSSAYISKSLICINDAERVNPKGDVTKCDESAKSPCYTKTELFCAALDQ